MRRQPEYWDDHEPWVLDSFQPEAIRIRVNEALARLSKIPAAGSQPATGKVLSVDEQSLTTAAPCQAQKQAE